LKRSIRISMASLLASGVLAAGFAVATAAPAGAVTAGSATLTCDTTTQAGKITCTANDADGMRTVAVYNAAARSNQFVLVSDCATPVTSQTFNVPVASRYRVTVVDCNKPRGKNVFIVKGDGSVTPVGV
jgi:hypothetical protein